MTSSTVRKVSADVQTLGGVVTGLSLIGNRGSTRRSGTAKTFWRDSVAHGAHSDERWG